MVNVNMKKGIFTDVIMRLLHLYLYIMYKSGQFETNNYIFFFNGQDNCLNTYMT